MPRRYTKRRRTTTRRTPKRRTQYKRYTRSYARGKAVRGIDNFQKELESSKNLGRTHFLYNGSLHETGIKLPKVKGIKPEKPSWWNRLTTSGIAWKPEDQSHWDVVKEAWNNPAVQWTLGLLGGKIAKDMIDRPASIPGYPYLVKGKYYGGKVLKEAVNLFDKSGIKKVYDKTLPPLIKYIPRPESFVPDVPRRKPPYINPRPDPWVDFPIVQNRPWEGDGDLPDFKTNLDQLTAITKAREWARQFNASRGYPDLREKEALDMLADMQNDPYFITDEDASNLLEGLVEVPLSLENISSYDTPQKERRARAKRKLKKRTYPSYKYRK